MHPYLLRVQGVGRSTECPSSARGCECRVQEAVRSVNATLRGRDDESRFNSCARKECPFSLNVLMW